jgi:hypothetical protein
MGISAAGTKGFTGRDNAEASEKARDFLVASAGESLRGFPHSVQKEEEA